jgi:hypothetical protein
MALPQFIISLLERLNLLQPPIQHTAEPLPDLKTNLRPAIAAATPDTIHTGPKGGQYRISETGQKVYLRQGQTQKSVARRAKSKPRAKT